MRGTVKGIEVERWGGEQARRYQAGSLNPSKTSMSAKELSRPAFALVFSCCLPRTKQMEAAPYGCHLLVICEWEIEWRDLAAINKRPALA